MSQRYSAVKWNRNKRVYDVLILAGVTLYVLVFFTAGKLSRRDPRAISDEILLIRALGTCAFLMLHIVLCIGPLARFDRRFLPVLYNRRHLGVATFLVGMSHGLLSTGYYHGFGRLNPLISLLTTNTNFRSVSAYPFEIFGLIALGLLFLLAAASHDFWQRNLGPSFWKGLHMLVYPAYALLVLHAALGVLQAERNPLYLWMVGGGAATVITLHLAAATREVRFGRGSPGRTTKSERSDLIDVGPADAIPENRAHIACPPGRERIAVFRYRGRISAVTNVCAHQRGPLGEGKIVDGCITCPWHGWQYRPENGQSPPPFNERIATFRVSIEQGRLLLDPRPLPPGTPIEPARIEESTDD